MFLRIHDVPILSRDDALNVVLKVFGPDGCAWGDLVRLLGKCQTCKRLMVTSFYDDHKCPPPAAAGNATQSIVTPVSSPSSSASKICTSSLWSCSIYYHVKLIIFASSISRRDSRLGAPYTADSDFTFTRMWVLIYTHAGSNSYTFNLSVDMTPIFGLSEDLHELHEIIDLTGEPDDM